MGEVSVPTCFSFLPNIIRSKSSPVGRNAEDGVYLIQNDPILGQGDDNGGDIDKGQNTIFSFPTICILTILGLFLLGGGSFIAFTVLWAHPPSRCETSACRKVGEEIKSFMDPGVDPCDDFYHYACGGWINLHPVKPEENVTSALNQLTQDNTKVIRGILESSEMLQGAGEKARNFYVSCLNKKDAPPTTTTTEEDLWELEDSADDDIIDNDDWWSDSELSLLEKTFTNIRSQLKPYLELPDRYDSLSMTCAALTTTLMPDVAARLFALRTFPRSKLEKVQSMLSSISSQYQTLVSDLSWMDTPTKTYLIRKLSSTSSLLGYPSSILDTVAETDNYDDIPVSSSGSSYYSNLAGLISHSQLDFLFIPQVDIVRIVPQANAFYTFITDRLVIPAGIVMPPFFSDSEDHPEIANWAKFATTLGHEYTHAFQEYFLGGWSTDGKRPVDVGIGSYTEFEKIKNCLENKYDNYKLANSSVILNGRSTWEENLADVLGLQVAFRAFFENRKFGKTYKVLPGLEGLTGEQIFFVAAAQVQCQSFASEEVRQRVLADVPEIDPHSPNSVRVLGQMSNNQEFAKAFNCPVGSRYNPPNKCSVFF